VRGVAGQLVAARPDLMALDRRQTELARKLRDGTRARLDTAATALRAIESHLKHLNPELVLERGYSIAMTASGAIVQDAAQLAAGDALRVAFARGSADATVTNTNP
jgi:exodeoxyribonuclease VII large subunit